MSKIYTDGMSKDELRIKLRELTDSTKDNHQVHDVRYPGFGPDIISFEPIRESKGIVADVMMTVAPGAEPPRDGDILIVPNKDRGIGQIGMIFDVESVGGDWGHLGDAYQVKAIPCNLQLGLGHEFSDKRQQAATGGRGR